MNERAQKIIRDIPPELKDALVAEAERTETNLNDVAVQIIADAYGVGFEPSGKGTPGLSDSLTIGIQMPRVLRRRLNVEAARKETTATNLILDVLLDHFDLLAAA